MELRDRDPWALYAALLDELPATPRVTRALVGRAWTLVEADSGGVGLAMTHREEVQPATLASPLAGRTLREVAAALRGWNVREAALGLAALNAWVNDPRRLEERLGRRLAGPHGESVFQAMRPELAGRRVAVVGHFPGIERLGDDCRLTVLERVPQPGDLPDFAAEYVLPEQDYVFITGVTLINKTLPRLLALAAGAQVVLVGPSVPLTPRWFELGVSVLAGSVVLDGPRLWRAAAEGSVREIWSQGAITVQLRPSDFGGAHVARAG
jgi:uncharacterized protein (DUF4213/DUF364 family)